MAQGQGDLIQTTIETLRGMGLTLYEARAYLALLQKSPSHGNDISRRSGVPGPKIYETLNRMTVKGLVSTLNTDPQLYTPLPYLEFLKLKKREFESAAAILEVNLRKVALSPPDTALWQLTDYEALLAKARDLLDDAAETVLISMWPEEGWALEDHLAAADRRGVSVISLQYGPQMITVGKVFPHLQSKTIHERHSGELTMVVDQRTGLFMGRPKGGEWNGLWTNNPGVVRLMTNYIRHDIYSNKLIHRFEGIVKAEFGEELEGLINLETDY
ncbi:MAG TPA: helix-turn-helix domain-containing protein [Syntrophales bacterium]|nr:helix-turn-helix domain-containing protein [Syntrophales bacterium]HON99643.1 helix-turn-helix domain-containing protein [Syntrophales bacterium]HRS86376.1 helix-turn-helix domain-containing protein [Syntrophales bacterium]